MTGFLERKLELADRKLGTEKCPERKRLSQLISIIRNEIWHQMKDLSRFASLRIDGERTGFQNPFLPSMEYTLLYYTAVPV